MENNKFQGKIVGWQALLLTNVIVFGENNRLARKTIIRAKMQSSKFEANPTVRLRLRRASFSLSLVSSCSNDYFCTYAIIYFSIIGWFSQIQSQYIRSQFLLSRVVPVTS